METAALISWESDYAKALERAKAERKQLLVYFHKEDCPGCHLMETVSFRDDAVAEYINRFFMPYEALLNNRATAQLYRDNHIIWTPGFGCADHRGQMHFVSPGFLPPNELLAALRIGRARCLIAWTRYAEAAEELTTAGDSQTSQAPEALFWLAATYFLWRRDDKDMHVVWAKLRELYPSSPWAKRTYSPAGTF